MIICLTTAKKSCKPLQDLKSPTETGIFSKASPGLDRPTGLDGI